MQFSEQLSEASRCDAFERLLSIEIPFQYQLAVTEHMHVTRWMIRDPTKKDESAAANLPQETTPCRDSNATVALL